MLPLELEKMFYDLQDRIMSDVVRRLYKTGNITSTADYQLNKAMILGGTTEYIESEIKHLTNMANAELWEIYDRVVEQDYTRNRTLYEQVNGHFIPYEENNTLQQWAEAVVKQTKGELKNISRSLGFRVDIGGGKKAFTPLAEYYQKYLDKACLDVVTGSFDYNTVLRKVVKEMTASGIQTVEYDTGYVSRAPVAARRAVMTGVQQLSNKMNEKIAKDLNTDYFEVTAHAGARPSHVTWQGRVFKYSELQSVCGLGDVGGLCGANCRHSYFAFIPGISSRTYSDEELENIRLDDEKIRSFRGKRYNGYEATQRQRQYETTMRAQRADIRHLKEGGADQELVQAAQAKYLGTLHEYQNFSRSMNLPEQMERVYMDGLGRMSGGRIPRKAVFASISKEGDGYNANAVFHISIPGVGKETEEKINRLCFDVIKKGGRDGNEHGYTIDLNTGETRYYTSGMAGEVFGKEFFDYLATCQRNSVVSIHNHADNRGFSYTDMNTFVTEKALFANIAACHNGKAYYVEENIKKFVTGTAFTDADLFDDIISELRGQMKAGKIETYQFSTLKEARCCERIAQLYFKKYEVIE